MPRRARQAPAAPNSQAYGAAGDQLAAQAEIPLPVDQTVVAAGPRPGPSPAGQSGPAVGPGGEPGTATPGPPGPIELAQMIPPPAGRLSDPSARPNEPLTAGLPIGAGPGPEVLGAAMPAWRQATPVADVLALVAQATGDPELARVAEDAAARRV